MNQQLINKYDSEFCGSLPIHLINVVQPYGALMVIEKASDKIIQVSENVEDFLGKPFNEIAGSAASEYLDVTLLNDIRDSSPHAWEIGGKKYLCILHDKPQYFILEVNLESESEAQDSSFINVYKELKQVISAIEAAPTLAQAASIAAKELKKASGFDKVMIYRFDENWNGFVIAEEREAEMESYLGFTFPASDIPRQARELYLKNAYRFIPDREHKPVKLYPFVNPATETFIDMSDCNVRGVSTVHLEYLKNMNVSASMSTRIIKDEKLWGLIACHHQTPMQVNYKMCSIFELLSGIISTRVATLENNEMLSLNNRISGNYTALIEEVYRNPNIEESLLTAQDKLMRLFGAGGAVISFRGQVGKAGAVPDDNGIEDLLLLLNSRGLETVYSTDSLSREFDYAKEYKETGAGLLAIPIDPENEGYILLFRPEVVQVINWGGDPEGRINFEQDMKTYHPRFSFKLWQEKVSGVSLPWQKEEIRAAENLNHFFKDLLDKENLSYTH